MTTGELNSRPFANIITSFIMDTFVQFQILRPAPSLSLVGGGRGARGRNFVTGDWVTTCRPGRDFNLGRSSRLTEDLYSQRFFQTRIKCDRRSGSPLSIAYFRCGNSVADIVPANRLLSATRFPHLKNDVEIYCCWLTKAEMRDRIGTADKLNRMLPKKVHNPMNSARVALISDLSLGNSVYR